MTGRRRSALEAPVDQLAGALVAAGRPELAAVLREQVPPPPGVLVDHDRSALVGALRRVQLSEQVEEAIQDEAGRLRLIAEDLVRGLGRRGCVWIGWGEGAYDLSWQPSGHDDLYENGPVMTSLAASLAWARHRSAEVVVRPSWQPGRLFWAGDGDPPEDMPRLHDT